MQAHTFLYDLTSIVCTIPEMANLIMTPQADGRVRVQSIDGDKTIILDAYTQEPVDGLDKVCGLSGLKDFRSALHAPGITPSTVQSVWIKDRFVQLMQGEQIYRLNLSSSGYAQAHYSPPPMKQPPPTYQVTAIPTTEGNELLRYWRKNLQEGDWGAQEHFNLELETSGSTLVAVYRFGWYERISFPLTEISTGKVSERWDVPSHHLGRLLPLVERTTRTLLKLSDRGLCTVEVSTACSTYNFHIPCFGIPWSEKVPKEWHEVKPLRP